MGQDDELSEATSKDPAFADRLSEGEIRPLDLAFDQQAAYARDIARMLARRDEFVEVACPACNATTSAPAFDKDGFSFRHCSSCATIYMNPRPSPDVMAAYYAASENYAHWARNIFPASEPTRRAKIHQPWFDRIVVIAEQNDVPLGTLVEVGPGFGTFCSVALDSGRFEKVVAVEPTPELAQRCRDRGIEVIERRIEDAADHLPPADIVCAFEVIEHLFDPGLFIAQCAKLVRPGGLLVLSCPNGQGFDIEALGPQSTAVDAEHVNLFNVRSLSRLVEAHSFAVLHISTPGRLDAEIVHKAAVDGRIDLAAQPFLRRVLVEDYERLGWPFQQFLAANKLSSHMWLSARRR